ncbi:uncharacterized protein [Procambarus clarkii]|uniref:uncharacterized protein n=1 Tax=Procambarus clarkii TaxID=6728 RepID=UPI003744043F
MTRKASSFSLPSKTSLTDVKTHRQASAATDTRRKCKMKSKSQKKKALERLGAGYLSARLAIRPQAQGVVDGARWRALKYSLKPARKEQLLKERRVRRLVEAVAECLAYMKEEEAEQLEQHQETPEEPTYNHFLHTPYDHSIWKAQLFLPLRCSLSGCWEAELYKLNFTRPRLSSIVAKLPYNLHKNRSQELVPADRYRYKLKPLRSRLRRSEPYDVTRHLGKDYINATVVNNGYQEMLVTPHPLPHTVGDFWRMVKDSGASTIIMLMDNKSNLAKFPRYWPLPGQVSRYFADTTSSILVKNQSECAYPQLFTEHNTEETQTRNKTKDSKVGEEKLKKTTEGNQEEEEEMAETVSIEKLLGRCLLMQEKYAMMDTKPEETQAGPSRDKSGEQTSQLGRQEQEQKEEQEEEEDDWSVTYQWESEGQRQLAQQRLQERKHFYVTDLSLHVGPGGRKVRHYHFDPERYEDEQDRYGGILHLLLAALNHQHLAGGPIILHCRDGWEACGAVVALSSLMQEVVNYPERPRIDVHQAVSRLKQFMPLALRNLKWYSVVYHCIHKFIGRESWWRLPEKPPRPDPELELAPEDDVDRLVAKARAMFPAVFERVGRHIHESTGEEKKKEVIRLFEAVVEHHQLGGGAGGSSAGGDPAARSRYRSEGGGGGGLSTATGVTEEYADTATGDSAMEVGLQGKVNTDSKLTHLGRQDQSEDTGSSGSKDTVPAGSEDIRPADSEDTGPASSEVIRPSDSEIEAKSQPQNSDKRQHEDMGKEVEYQRIETTKHLVTQEKTTTEVYQPKQTSSRKVNNFTREKPPHSTEGGQEHKPQSVKKKPTHSTEGGQEHKPQSVKKKPPHSTEGGQEHKPQSVKKKPTHSTEGGQEYNPQSVKKKPPHSTEGGQEHKPQSVKKKPTHSTEGGQEYNPQSVKKKPTHSTEGGQEHKPQSVKKKPPHSTEGGQEHKPQSVKKTPTHSTEGGQEHKPQSVKKKPPNSTEGGQEHKPQSVKKKPTHSTEENL